MDKKINDENLMNHENELDEMIDISKYQNVRIKTKPNWFYINFCFFLTIIGILIPIDIILLVVKLT